MTEVYWGFFAGGVILAFVIVLFGDVLDGMLDGMLDGVLDFLSLEFGEILNPMILVGGATVFGGAGILLTEYTAMQPVPIAVCALLLAVFCSLLVYFLYIKPMKKAENSTAFSIRELSGKIGEIITPVPSHGYGEILIRVGAGMTNQIAASFDHEEIASGTRVVVVEVKDNVLYVSPFTEGIS